MKLVTFASFKGGCGKTTSVMALASSYVAQGKKVALLDADENAPLAHWKEAAMAQDTWSDKCAVLAADDLQSLEASYAVAEKSGCDIAIIDTRGGGSELNNACMTSANHLIVPSALTTLDMVSALETFEYAIDLFGQMSIEVPTSLLIQRAPMTKLTVSQKADWEALCQLPHLTTFFHARDAYAALGRRGLLHKTLDHYSNDLMKRFNATHIANALREADMIANEIWQMLENT